MWRDDSTLDRMTAKAKITWTEREGREGERKEERGKRCCSDLAANKADDSFSVWLHLPKISRADDK